MSIYDIYFSNFGRPPVPDDLCKDSVPRHPRFWRRRFLKVFTMYGHGGHLGQWTATILANFRSPILRRLHMKFEQNWLWGFRGSGASEEKSFENVNGRTHGWTDDGRKVITIAHPEQCSGELKTECCLLQILFVALRVNFPILQMLQWNCCIYYLFGQTDLSKPCRVDLDQTAPYLHCLPFCHNILDTLIGSQIKLL